MLKLLSETSEKPGMRIGSHSALGLGCSRVTIAAQGQLAVASHCVRERVMGMSVQLQALGASMWVVE
jgi:hypothetical protein